MASAPWQHPQANREALLQGRRVAYWLKRGQRRTIGFSVGAQGLAVSAPRWATLATIDAALQSKAAWVLAKLAEARQRHSALESDRVVWADGTTLAWLGRTLVVRLGAGQPAARGAPLVQWQAASNAEETAATEGPDGIQAPAGVLWVALPTTASAAQLRDAVQAWMMQTAHAHFSQRLNHFAPLLGVRWTALKLSAAATRWGSAKADGSIRLHWRLMQFPPEVVDYVVAHELAHLRHMDHSERFWRTVASVVPDYAALRARLRGERLPPW